MQRKRFGQHFLIDPLVVDEIIKLVSPKPNDHILEIGPGTGALTKQLVDSGASVVAVEIDRDLCSLLERDFSHAQNVRVVNEDILKLDLNQLLRNDRPWKLVGNLPYNISAPLVLRLLQLAACFSRLFIMLQTEVANRLAASPGTKAYGRLSVITQLRCSVIHRLDVDATSFRPKPAVRSSVVELSPIPGAKDQELEAWLSLLVDKAFSKRRKILANSLHQCIDLETLIRCDIDPTWRPEQLSVEDFLRLARETRPGTNVPATED